MKKKRGVALISVLAIIAISLIVVSVATVVSIINSQMSLAHLQTQKAQKGAEGLADEAIIRFIRDPNFTNPYPDWTEDCLQIEDFDCKMEISLTPPDGVIDVWGKSADKTRHLQIELVINDDQSVSVSAQREIN